MLTFGASNCAALNAATPGTDAALGLTYYDAERVYFQIADYTGDTATWNPCAQRAELIYKGYVEKTNGAVAGYWIFTKGLLMDWQRNADPGSRDDVISLSQHAAYAPDFTPSSRTISETRSREVAYNIDAELDAEALGLAHRARTDLLITQAMGHIDQWIDDTATRVTLASGVTNGTVIPMPSFDQNLYIAGENVRFTSPPGGFGTLDRVILSTTTTSITLTTPITVAAGDTVEVFPDFAPFMGALTSEALIKAFNAGYAPTAPAKIKQYLDFITANSAIGDTFYYRRVSSPGGAPDLNLIICPVYAWQFLQSGTTSYRDKSDAVFNYGVLHGFINNDGKHFDQDYRWSFLYLRWRLGISTPMP